MADLVITASSVVAQSNAVRVSGIAGAAITAGKGVFEDADDANKWKLIDTTDYHEFRTGIALNGAAIGQPVTIAVAGDVNLGVTLVPGEAYIASPLAAGGIAPYADIDTGDGMYILGMARTTSLLAVQQLSTGAAYAE